MKRRNFLSGLLALPFVRWFVPRRFAPTDFETLRGPTSELSWEQIDALILLNQTIKHWNEEAISKGLHLDWRKRPFRLD
jgi:hypothetical protein